MAGDDGRRPFNLRAFGTIALAAAIGSVPSLHPAVSVTDGPLRWVFWTVAALAIGYVAITFVRLVVAHDLSAGVRWLLTGSRPEG